MLAMKTIIVTRTAASKSEPISHSFLAWLPLGRVGMGGNAKERGVRFTRLANSTFTSACASPGVYSLQRAAIVA